MPKNRFRNSDGSLTMYAFACGYIEKSPEGVELSKDGCWHIKYFSEEFDMRIWETATLLSDARKIFRATRQTVKKQIKSSK